MVAQFLQNGWAVFPSDPQIPAWVRAASPVATAITKDPEQTAQWLQCQGTWFVGVDALPNDTSGRVGQGPALGGAALEYATRIYGKTPLHRAQISVMYPGYPRPRHGESDAAFGYRLNRDAAHVDGLLAIGESRARHLREPHGYILGLPLNQTNANASPMVVWQGSHHIMRAAFSAALSRLPVSDWPNIDLTETYHAARRQVFETCRRVVVHASPGQAYLVHRLALHGVASWGQTATAPCEGRMIAYLRPEFSEVQCWLSTP